MALSSIFYMGVKENIIANLCDIVIFGFEFGRGTFFDFIAILALSAIRCIFGYEIRIISFVLFNEDALIFNQFVCSVQD